MCGTRFPSAEEHPPSLRSSPPLKGGWGNVHINAMTGEPCVRPPEQHLR